MAHLWIVDRSPRRRTALARLAAAPASAILGAPGDPRFDAGPEPDVVLLALDDDWERELQFAFASGDRAAHARWILLREGLRHGEDAAIRAAFDTREVEVVAFPPTAQELRTRIRHPAGRRAAPPLSDRQRRSRVAERFARWFEDLELPDVLRALDPKLSDVPVAICGEPGSGRSVVARYLHFFAGPGSATLARVACDPDHSPAGLARALAEAAAPTGPGTSELTLWLEDPDRLPRAAQRALLDWFETGLPGGVSRAARVRFVSTTTPEGQIALDEALRLALGGIAITLPALRERPHAIARIADETIRAWCAARQERPRRLGEDARVALEEYPWPGNLRELDALLVQSLASAASDPLRADDLVLDGVAFSPLEASELGALLEDEPAEAPQVPHAVADVPGHTDPLEDEIEALLDGPLEGAETPMAPEVAEARSEEGALAALANAVSSEVRNPLLTLRTFAEILPERFDDPVFRDRFAEALQDDLGRMDALVKRLGQVAHLSKPLRDKVDVAALLESLLEERRQRIRAQRLLVLKELDTHEPHALCDPAQLRFALDTLLGKALDWVPPRGDVYLASRHHAQGPSSEASVRVLIRFHDPGGASAPAEGPGPVENSFELVICEIVIRAQGGSLSVSATDGEETVIVLDLPA